MNTNEYFEDVRDMNQLYNKLYSMSKSDLIQCFDENDYNALREESEFENANLSKLSPFMNQCKYDEKTAFELVKYLNLLYDRNVRVLPFESKEMETKDVARVTRDTVRKLGIVELDLVDTIVYGDIEMPQGRGSGPNELFTIVGKMTPNKELYKAKKVWVRTLSDVNFKRVIRYYTDFRKYLKSLVHSLKLNQWSSNDLYSVLDKKIDFIECFLYSGMKVPPKITEKRKITSRRPVNVSFIVPNILKRTEKKKLRNMFFKTTTKVTDEDLPPTQEEERIFENFVKEKNVRILNVTESLDELFRQGFILSDNKTRMFFRPTANGFLLFPVYRHPRVTFPIPSEYRNSTNGVLPVYDSTVRFNSTEGTINQHYFVNPTNRRVIMSEYYIEVMYDKDSMFVREGIPVESVFLLDISKWKNDIVIDPSKHSNNMFKLSLLNKKMFDKVNEFIQPFIKKNDTDFAIALNFAIQQIKRIGLHGYKILRRKSDKKQTSLKYLFTSRKPSKVDPLVPTYNVLKRRKMINNVEVFEDIRVVLTNRAKYLMKNLLSVFPEYKRYDYYVTGEYVNYLNLNDIVLSGEKDPTTGYDLIDESDVYEAIVRTDVSNKFTPEGLKEERIKKNFEKIILERRKKGEPFKLFDAFDIDKYDIQSIYDLPNPYFD